MNAKNTDRSLPKNRVSLEVSVRADLLARKATLELLRNALQGNVRGLPATQVREPELLASVVNPNISRASKIAAISTTDDVALLVDIAAANTSIVVRRCALQRIDEVLDGRPLSQVDVERLASCLVERELFAFAVVLMDIAGFDWCARCDENTVGVLGVALHECQSIHETVLLEDAFAQLIHSRPDLGRNLRACSPGKLHLRAMYAPLIVNNVVYVDMTKEDNVA